ncbi:hypothetical protein RLOC_00001610 [Lonchura striata]|uniref:Maestro/Maestro-like HEAT-repeats domain-containing protein n=1 Tax=Lonchura striata TaxID=40157 RepID=A0A218UL39_9PASE|nr:hypothetical protein RLOC_00001610 [Lonchura striata domestica]
MDEVKCRAGTKAGLADSEFSEASLLQVATDLVTDTEQRPPRVPKLAWLKEEEEGPGAAPVHETEEVVPFKQLQEYAALDRTQEQEPAHGRFRRTAQTICQFITCIWQEETTGVGTRILASFHLFSAKTSAAMLDLLVEKGVSNAKQVPAMVRYIHRWLMANKSAEHRLDKALLELTKEYPSDVLITLLRWAPSCDRHGIPTCLEALGFTSPPTLTVEPALQILLDVLSAWPEDSMYTSDGESTGVFALAAGAMAHACLRTDCCLLLFYFLQATLTLWTVFNLTWCPPVALEYFPNLFLHLLFQAYISTLDMPEEVDTFWKKCQEQHSLAAHPNSFALQTLKALLCQMQYEDVMLVMECRCAWNTLLCADTHHYAVGLLSREMHCVSIIWCCSIASCLFDLLSQDISDWELPALAFLVEVLDCLDLSACSEKVLQIMTKHLQSKSRDVCRVALRRLVVLSQDPSMNERMYSLTESLGNLLRAVDEDIVEMTVVVLSSLLFNKDLAIASPIALQLAEALWQLFDNMVCKFMRRIWEEESSIMGTVIRAYSPIFKTKTSAALLDMLVEEVWRVLWMSGFGREAMTTLLCPLQATVLMWKILQVPCVPHVVTMYFPGLFVHLLFQVLFSTLDVPEVVDTFWKGCQQQHGLATNPSNFAEQTLKALLCRLHYEDVVVTMEDKRGWDTLLCADTHHCAVGVLAREMHRASEAVCSVIAFQLLGLLSKDTPCRDLATLAFLVEILERLNLSECRDSVLEFLSKNLKSECMWRLCPGGLKKLMLRSFFLPLIQKDSQVQLCSMFVLREMLDFFPEEEKKALKAHVCQSLLPLFFHCHDENQRVAEASQETLLCAAEFFKRRDLGQLVKNQKLWQFTECLLAEDSSSVAEHLRWALPYLQSPQEPLREAAVRFMALEGMANDISVAITNLAIQTLYVLQEAERAPYSIFDNLHDRLCRAWRRRPL